MNSKSLSFLLLPTLALLASAPPALAMGPKAGAEPSSAPTESAETVPAPSIPDVSYRAPDSPDLAEASPPAAPAARGPTIPTRAPEKRDDRRDDSCCADSWNLAEKESHSARSTGYYPNGSAMEGGYKDRKGKSLKTLQAFISGHASYVSVAMDAETLPYGQRICSPELNSKVGKAVPLRVVDTGGAFHRKGLSRVDICTGSRSAAESNLVNRQLTITVCK